MQLLSNWKKIISSTFTDSRFSSRGVEKRSDGTRRRCWVIKLDGASDTCKKLAGIGSKNRVARSRLRSSEHPSFLVFILYPIFLRFLFSFLWSSLSFIGVNIIFFLSSFSYKSSKKLGRECRRIILFFFFSTATIFRSRVIVTYFSLSLFSLFSIQIEWAFRMKIYRIRKIVSARDNNDRYARYYHIYISFPSLVFFSLSFFFPSVCLFFFFNHVTFHASYIHSFAPRGPRIDRIRGLN